MGIPIVMTTREAKMKWQIPASQMICPNSILNTKCIHQQVSCSVMEQYGLQLFII